MKQNPKAKSFKKETRDYQKPTEKVEGETVTMVKYFLLAKPLYTDGQNKKLTSTFLKIGKF